LQPKRQGRYYVRLKVLPVLGGFINRHHDFDVTRHLSNKNLFLESGGDLRQIGRLLIYGRKTSQAR
jgi:hypothetical protein